MEVVSVPLADTDALVAAGELIDAQTILGLLLARDALARDAVADTPDDTAPGNTAADGTGAHSPFTTALLKHIGESGVEVNQMLTRVRIEVATAAEKKQIPWVNSSLARRGLSLR